MSTNNTEIPESIRLALQLVGGDHTKAFQLASIFGYNGSPVNPVRLSDGSFAPVSQTEAAEKIEAMLKSIKDAMDAKTKLDTQITQLQSELATTKQDKDKIATELADIKKSQTDVKTTELAKLVEEVKKTDTDGIFLESIKSLDVDAQTKIVTAYLQKSKGSNGTDVNLQRDNAKNPTKAELEGMVNEASKKLFGEDVESLVKSITRQKESAS